MMRLIGLLLLAALALGCSKDPGPIEDVEARNRRAQAQAQLDAEIQAAELSPEKQEAIWEAEHITFELEWQFGPPFKEALRSGNRKRLATAFRQGFIGGIVPTRPTATREGANSGIQEAVYAKADVDQPVVAEELIDALLTTTVDWSQVSVGLRVLNINKLPEDHRWSTRILLIQDGIKDGMVQHAESEHLVEWTIEDESKMADAALIDRWQMETRTVRRSQHAALMEEVTEAAGLADAKVFDNWNLPSKQTQQYRFATAVADFNRDGNLDIAVASLEQYPMVLMGSKSLKFHDITQHLGIMERQPLLNVLAAWVDYDNDGYPDLLLGDRFYRNENGRKFVDVTRQSGLLIHPECMGASVVDYDADGKLDLYMLYQREWDSGGGTPGERWVDEKDSGRQNELWKNLGDRFVNVTSHAQAGGGRRHTHSAAWFFYDDDHYPDVYTANDFGKNTLLRNRGDGTFEDVSEASGASDFATSMGVATGDLDNNGSSEIYVANMYSKMGRRIIALVDASDYPEGIYEQILGACAGNRLYTQDAPGKPCQESAVAKGISHVGWAFGPAFADFDNNGLLDVYSTTGFMSFHRGKPDG